MSFCYFQSESAKNIETDSKMSQKEEWHGGISTNPGWDIHNSCHAL